MKPIWARIDQPITLPCELESGLSAASSSDQLEWRKNGSLIFNAFGTEPGFFASEYQGRLSRASAMDLTIHSVEPNDQAIFCCSISRFPRGKTVGGREYGKLIRLIVHSMPRILEPLDGSKIIAKENISLRQNCLADGIPFPSIKWSKKMKDDNWVTVSNNNQLTIERFSADDEGQFNCEAQNFEGTQNAIVTLKMRRALRIERENPSLLNRTALEGSSVFWQCSVEGQKQLAAVGKVRIRWTKGGKAINELAIGLRAHINDGSFGIMHLRRTDSGEFECSATFLGSSNDDVLLESDNVKVHLNVQYRPEISSESRRLYTLASGDPADLECLIIANPLPTVVRWTKNGRQMTANVEKSLQSNQLRSTVHIPSANVHNSAGIYTCEAENAVGVTDPSLEIHVVVAEVPKFTKIPAPNYLVRAGERVDIACEGFAEVPIRRIWIRKDNGKHLSFLENKFVLPQVTHSDHGFYCCVLISSVGTVSRDVQLIVYGTAPQCATKVRIHCERQQRFSVHWTQGYAGGNYSQSFRIFYRQRIKRNGSNKEETEIWKVTDYTEQSDMHLDDLALFGEYQLQLEASNRIGAINCTVPGTHYTCSKLEEPSNFLLRDETTKAEKAIILQWDEVKEANSYKIKFRKHCEGNRENGAIFQEIVQTSETIYKLSSSDKLKLNAKCCYEFVVQSVRLPFPNSDHSAAIAYPSSSCSFDINPSNSIAIFLFSSCALFLLLLMIIFAFFYSLQRHLNGSNNGTNLAAKLCQRQRFNQRKIGKYGKIGGESEEKASLPDSFDYSSSHCDSTSTTASVYAQCAFGHPIAITRKLFPENYICTKFARFDEEAKDEDNKSEECFGHFPNDDIAFLNDFNGIATISDNLNENNKPNNKNDNKFNWLSEKFDDSSNKTYAICMEMKLADGEIEEKRNAVGEMLREKYIFADAELNILQELRIEQLRRELSKNSIE